MERSLEKPHDTPSAAADTNGADAAYTRHLHRFLVGRLRNREDAGDLAQEAYLRYLQLPDSSVVRKPSDYLFRIAFNLISEWRLRRDRSAVTSRTSVRLPGRTPRPEWSSNC